MGMRVAGCEKPLLFGWAMEAPFTGHAGRTNPRLLQRKNNRRRIVLIVIAGFGFEPSRGAMGWVLLAFVKIALVIVHQGRIADAKWTRKVAEDAKQASGDPKKAAEEAARQSQQRI